ncbi:MAG: cysteine desulfurase NifS [Clostridiales bacterium]|nr:cysteine desulfurase NifS [Clostridiales bacterium]
MREVYVDNAATTAVLPEVIDAMMPYWIEKWGNPSSLHSKGQEVVPALDNARQSIADLLGCSRHEIFFTSGGSESDNWAIKGVMRRSGGKKHLITTQIEHHAVLHTCKALEKEGYKVTYIGVDERGIVKLSELEAAIDDDTALVAVMMANNEIGTIQPIKEIVRIAHSKGVLVFTDAVQAVGAIPVNVQDLGVDLLALSGHKFHAPKGIGALYVRKGVRLQSLIDGGGQERGRRGGTENVAMAVALAKALEIAVAKLPENDRIVAMRDRLIDGLMKIPHTILNGDRSQRLPGNVNVAFEFIEGESLILLLDRAGIYASTGSACSTASLDPSHVLLALGLPHEKAHGSLRLSLSHENTEEDIDYILETVPGIVKRLRDMSPLYNSRGNSK